MTATNTDALTFAVIAGAYGAGYQKSMVDADGSPEDLAIYAFHDGVKRTATAFVAVCDGKRKPGEALQEIRDYVEHLRELLAEEGDE